MFLRVSLAILLLCLCLSAEAQLRLPRLLSDNAILQRERPVKLFGWSAANEKVLVLFKNGTYETKANESGKWTVELPPQKAGGPYELKFTGEKNEITLKNVLFGDVWLCSGQSNMEMKVNNVKEKYADIVAASSNSFIRHFEVPQKYDFQEPHEDLDGGQWKEANPENTLQFSAVAYFFAKDLYDKLKVPIGLVNASLGGSPAESWMSEDALADFPSHLDEAKKFRDNQVIQDIESSDRNRINAWYNEIWQKDIGVKNKWRNGGTDSSWYTMQLPGYWPDQGKIGTNGVVWFTRTFQVTRPMAGREGQVLFGRVVDQDSVFINGEFVGTTSYQYPQRRYRLKSGLLREGKNTISVKVINQSGKGGFVEDKPYQIIAEKDTIDLRGEWKYKLGTPMAPLASQTFIRWKPLGLYNAMIAPLIAFPIKGALWYQGESNVGRYEEYKKLLPALIKNWRSKWNDDFPFLFVQLANFLEAKSTPVESSWAGLRQAQLETLKVPRTGMAVIIDAGEWNDIHPLDKKTVGKRLALNAFKIAYNNKKIVAQGPMVKKTVFGNKFVDIEFANASDGLVAKGSASVKHVAISADGKNFVWANCEINKNKMRVWNDSVINPTVVRYAWADNPETANLYNNAGLPTSPFEVRK
jgi:sialate O-acetylesterase